MGREVNPAPKKLKFYLVANIASNFAHISVWCQAKGLSTAQSDIRRHPKSSTVTCKTTVKNPLLDSTQRPMRRRARESESETDLRKPWVKNACTCQWLHHKHRIYVWWLATLSIDRPFSVAYTEKTKLKLDGHCRSCCQYGRGRCMHCILQHHFQAIRHNKL